MTTDTPVPADAELLCLMAAIDQLVEHAREDDRLCYEQVPSQRYVNARENLRAVLARWGHPSGVGEVVVTKTEAGQIVAVTRQDEEGRILSVIAESAPRPTQTVPLTQAQIVEAFCQQPHPVQFVSAFNQGVRFAERHHGITK
jgi:hypothetical protein